MFKPLFYSLLLVSLIGCGGGSGGSGGQKNPPNDSIQHSFRIITSNLDGALTLQLVYGPESQEITISQSIYEADLQIDENTDYSLTVLNSPNEQICEITSGETGVISNEIKVTILCGPAHRLTIGAFNIPDDVHVKLSTNELAIIPANSTSFTFKSKLAFQEDKLVNIEIEKAPDGYGCALNTLSDVSWIRDTTRYKQELYCFQLNQKVVDISANLSAFSALREDGTVFTWGEYGSGGDTTFELKDLSNVAKLSKSPYGKGLVYTAIYTDGSVLAWGGSEAIGADSSTVETLLPNTYEVFSNGFSQIAVTTDNRIVGWGSELYGGLTRLTLSHPIDTVTQTTGAYAALLTDSSDVTWGSAQFGGDITHIEPGLDNVTQIVGTLGGYAALKQDGTVVTWPDSNLVTPDPQEKLRLVDVKKLVAHETGFAAILENGGLEVWADVGGTFRFVDGVPITMEEWAEQQTNVESVVGNGRAYAIIYKDRTAAAFGASEYGAEYSSVESSLNNVKNIVASNNNSKGSFAALRFDGSVVTWGTTTAGNSDSVSHLLSDVEKIYANDYAFAALKSDGSVVAWGDALRGGDSSSVSKELTGVEKIYSTLQAFAALRSDGSVVTWGNPVEGGDSSHIAQQLNR